MAMHRGKQREWPTVKRNPEAFFLTPDCFQRSDRKVAGPLRYGTAPNVGPKSRGFLDDRRSSDFGMDRLEQRPVDSIGLKYPETDPPVSLIANQLRGRR
jgi:hypothetical protein